MLLLVCFVARCQFVVGMDFMLFAYLDFAGEMHRIRHFGYPTGTVVSLFSGTGTTAIAALREGRNCFCIDMNIQDLEQRLQRFHAENRALLVKSGLGQLSEAEVVASQQSALVQIDQLFQGLTKAMKMQLTDKECGEDSDLFWEAVAKGFSHTWEAWKYFLYGESTRDSQEFQTLIGCFKAAPQHLLQVDPAKFSWGEAMAAKKAHESGKETAGEVFPQLPPPPIAAAAAGVVWLHRSSHQQQQEVVWLHRRSHQQQQQQEVVWLQLVPSRQQ
jgi:hypothetical protein